MLPQVTVVIPCYNYGKYLKEAIKSVIDSTYENIRIVIVNDGSDDPDTIKILEDISCDNEMIMVINQRNCGLSAARNAGIRAAVDAKYIVPLDADDMIEKTYIEKGVKILEERKDISYVYSMAKLFGDIEKVWETPPYNFNHLKFHNFIPATIIMRRTCWEAIGGYDERMKNGYEDWEFLLRAGKNGYHGYQIPEILFYYRKHQGSMLSMAKLRHRELVSILQKKHPDLYRLKYIDFTKFAFTELYRRIYKKMRRNPHK